jgi:hypothetical protein
MQLVEADGLSFPTGSFVVLMHQGYQFLALGLSGIDFYREGSGVFKHHYASFLDFLLSAADVHPA